MKQNKGISQNIPMGVRLVLSVLASVLVTLTVSAILTICINSEYIGIKQISIWGHVIRFISVLAGGILAINLAHRSQIAVVVAGAVIYYLVMIIGAMLFFGGVGGGVISGLVSVLIAMATGVLLLSYKKKSKFKSRTGKRYS